MKIAQIQLGKNGLTDNFMETLNSHFKNHESVKIVVLKGAGHEKAKVKEYSNEILAKLGKNYTFRIVGFRIIFRKWRKARL